MNQLLARVTVSLSVAALAALMTFVVCKGQWAYGATTQVVAGETTP